MSANPEVKHLGEAWESDVSANEELGLEARFDHPAASRAGVHAS
jgi:hypothetical protein